MSSCYIVGDENVSCLPGTTSFHNSRALFWGQAILEPLSFDDQLRNLVLVFL